MVLFSVIDVNIHTTWLEIIVFLVIQLFQIVVPALDHSIVAPAVVDIGYQTRWVRNVVHVLLIAVLAITI